MSLRTEHNFSVFFFLSFFYFLMGEGPLKFPDLTLHFSSIYLSSPSFPTFLRSYTSFPFFTFFLPPSLPLCLTNSLHVFPLLSFLLPSYTPSCSLPSSLLHSFISPSHNLLYSLPNPQLSPSSFSPLPFSLSPLFVSSHFHSTPSCLPFPCFLFLAPSTETLHFCPFPFLYFISLSHLFPFPLFLVSFLSPLYPIVLLSPPRFIPFLSLMRLPLPPSLPPSLPLSIFLHLSHFKRVSLCS